MLIVILMIKENKSQLLGIIEECMKTSDINGRAVLLQHLNGMLPLDLKIAMPAFITNGWINHNLYSLEEKILIL
jgi:hypothetical protein